MPSISSVLITYNEGQFLPLTLPPLVQTSDEVIVLDMGSTDSAIDICRSILRPSDRMVAYKRENLFEFGFSHPRNYAAAFANCDYIFVVDADELVDPSQLLTSLSSLDPQRSSFDVERRNYERSLGMTLQDVIQIREGGKFTTERHRRIYRRNPRNRFEGLIHEELWEGDTNAFFTCGHGNVTLHHLSSFREGDDGHTKGELYAYLLMKAYHVPGLRFGTNEWFFQTYVPEHFEVLKLQASNFALAHRLPLFA